jgi:hypothetical protein
MCGRMRLRLLRLRIGDNAGERRTGTAIYYLLEAETALVSLTKSFSKLRMKHGIRGLAPRLGYWQKPKRSGFRYAQDSGRGFLALKTLYTSHSTASSSFLIWTRSFFTSRRVLANRLI